MYRPRRTSEFRDESREDGGLPNKRQTRSQIRTTNITPRNKASQLNSWQAQSRVSQIGHDRDRGTPLRTTRSLATSNVTPMRHRGASSVERPAALHTDKKWVQEQSQLLAEYLHEMVQTHALQGFSSEYFSRGGASLRQMTIKQFVAIVNYFLQFIWPNRTTVGTNYVEDMTSALHKLKYPYQVNKSWLMTPTTQHSFGHVVVMLDYIKDIAAPSSATDQDVDHIEEFPFMETNEQHSYLQTTLDHTALSTSHFYNVIITEKTNQLIYSNAAESFALWDNQEWDKYEVFKRKASNKIIQCLCDLPDSDALDADLVRQQNEIDRLDEQIQFHGDNQHEKLDQLRAQEQQLQQQLLATTSSLKEHIEKTEEMCQRTVQSANSIKMERKQLQQLQRKVNSQKVMSDEFHRTKSILKDLQNEEQVYKRHQRDFAEHSDNQQVRLSRAKKQLLDQVERFNKHAQNIGLDSDICSASENDQLELLLPLPLQQRDIYARSKTLKKLTPMLEQRSAKHEKRHRQLEHLKPELTLQIKNIETNLNLINTQIQSFEHQTVQLAQSYKTKFAMCSQHQQQLMEITLKLNTDLEQLQGEHDELDQLLLHKRQQNEEFLCAAERHQEERLSARRAYLKEHNAKLAQAEKELELVNASIEQNAIKLADFKSLIEGTDLPLFTDELELAIKMPN